MGTTAIITPPTEISHESQQVAVIIYNNLSIDIVSGPIRKITPPTEICHAVPHADSIKIYQL